WCLSLPQELRPRPWSSVKSARQSPSRWPPIRPARTVAGRFGELLLIVRLVDSVLPFSHSRRFTDRGKNRCSCSWLVVVCEHERRARSRLWRLPGSVSLFQHLFDFSLSFIDRKTVGQTGDRIIVTQRHLVGLVPSIGGRCRTAEAQRLHLAIRHRLELPDHAQILVHDIERIHSPDPTPHR